MGDAFEMCIRLQHGFELAGWKAPVEIQEIVGERRPRFIHNTRL